MSKPIIPLPPDTSSENLVDRQQVIEALDVFAGLRRCFTLEEFFQWLGPGAQQAVRRNTLASDARFICVEGQAPADVYYVPEEHLFHWLINLNIRMSRTRQRRLSAHQLATVMTSLRQEGRWSLPPTGAVRYGERLYLLGGAYTEGNYVFPLAWLLSRATSRACADTVGLLTGEGRAWAQLWPNLTFSGIEKLVEDGFSCFPKRVAKVVRLREGLEPEGRWTLQRIGDVLGLTRERVRQVEATFWDKVSRVRALRQPFLRALLTGFMANRGSLLVDADSTHGHLMAFCGKCIGIPSTRVGQTQLLVLGAIPQDLAILESVSFLQHGRDRDALARAAGFGNELCVLGTDAKIPGFGQRRVTTMADALARAADSSNELCVLGTDLKTLVESTRQLTLRHLGKGQKVCLAMQAIGKPAHFSKIAEVYNSMFPDDPSSEHNIHAVLGREQHGVVWVGMRGTFALQQWGYERPSTGLFDAVTDIVRRKQSETGKPVPFNVIAGEISGYRQLVNPTSLMFASHFNPSLRRVSGDCFILAQPGEPPREEAGDEELDRVLEELERRSSR